MDIKILGTGCPKCKNLAEQVTKAASELNLECTIEKVTDIQAIMSHGVLMTPALVIDGKVRVVGKVPGIEALKKELQQQS